MPEEPQQPYEFGPPEINWRLALLWVVLVCSSLTVSGLAINQMLRIVASLI